MMRRRELMMLGGGLPSAYRRVEYIENTDSAYIQTNYTPTIDDVISVIAEPTQASSAYRVVLSAGTGTYQLVVLFPSTPGYGGAFFRYFSDTAAPQFNDPAVANNKYIFSVSYSSGNGHLYINGNDTTSSRYVAALDGNDTTMSILMRRNVTSPYYGKLYGVRVTRDSALKLNLLPCIRKSDNKPGMYDTVSHTFYTNAGTGEFIVPN